MCLLPKPFYNHINFFRIAVAHTSPLVRVVAGLEWVDIFGALVAILLKGVVHQQFPNRLEFAERLQ